MNARKSLRLLLPAAALLAATTASAVSAETSYETGLREWTSAGYRVQSGAVYLSSMQRDDSIYGHVNAEVAGIQLGPDAAPAPAPLTYEQQLRQFSSGGYRIHSGWVSTASIARR